MNDIENKIALLFILGQLNLFLEAPFGTWIFGVFFPTFRVTSAETIHFLGKNILDSV